MIQLFKAKSLKENTKTEEGTKNKNAKKQKGRSMVEMLGVLAIIGVLSIGGISGYTIAMRKYRANEILNIANKYALTLYTSCQTAMQRDPEHYYVDDYRATWIYNDTPMYRWHCPNLAFTDSGLGSLPAGVTAIQSEYGIASLSYNPSSSYSADNIIPENGNDIVLMAIEFESKELCDAFYSIIGSSSFAADSDCDHSWGNYNYTAFVEN